MLSLEVLVGRGLHAPGLRLSIKKKFIIAYLLQSFFPCLRDKLNSRGEVEIKLCLPPIPFGILLLSDSTKEIYDAEP